MQIEYAAVGSNCSKLLDGVCHIKTLDCLSVVQSVEGTYDITLSGGNKHSTSLGGFFVAPSSIQQTIVHRADKDTKQMSFRWLFLSIKINNAYYFDDIYELPVILPKDAQEKMNAAFDEIFLSKNVFKQYSCYYKVAEILASVSKPKETPIGNSVKSAINFIKNNYSRKITIDHLAKVVNLSQSRLFSLFKKEFGVSPISYINSYRLSVAANELTETQKTVTQIACAVGIDDPIYFNKMFKKAYQLSPTQYRKTYTIDK